jgi:hypothetical protein
LQPPRNYQALLGENARAPEPASQVEKQEAPSRTGDTGKEPEPHRPEQAPSIGRVTDSGGMVAQHALANDLMKQNRANAALREGAQPDMSANSPSSTEQKSDKAQLAADLKDAREVSQLPYKAATRVAPPPPTKPQPNPTLRHPERRPVSRGSLPISRQLRKIRNRKSRRAIKAAHAKQNAAPGVTPEAAQNRSA